ncbi:MAG: adenine-specific methyltransferase EcoRI family protein [Bacteroidaceae bacterium]|nr:adenine-specific methyltransferase EcoRI family protein [Bacteroidaceae bacterium]
MANKNLNAAKTAKKDEFYTQMADIERELQHYWPHFRDKVVLCNCDDPYESNFFKYFALNFNQLGLKKLICTCFDGSPVLGNELLLDFGDFTDDPKKMAYKVEITEVKDLNGDGAVDLADVQYLLKNDKNAISLLKQHGDFRSAECIELLKEADIVVTNPPFSLFREYIGQLMQYEKKFLIIGNQNNVTYKEVFPLITHNELWLGYKSGDMAFKVPSDYEERETRYWQDENGQKWRSLGNICWYTNLDHNKRHEELDLVNRYSPDDYPTYDNYEAIEVGRVDEIPCNYSGVMGVPITFLDKYNPDQFEIIGATENEASEEVKELRIQGFTKYDRPYIKGIRKYARILIRNKNPQTL